MRKIAGEQGVDRDPRLQRVAKISAQHRQQAVQVLPPQRAIGAVGEAHFGDLRRAEAKVRILELDQHRIPRQNLQQHEGEGERRPQHQDTLAQPAEKIVAHRRLLSACRATRRRTTGGQPLQN